MVKETQDVGRKTVLQSRFAVLNNFQDVRSVCTEEGNERKRKVGFMNTYRQQQLKEEVY